MKELQHIYNCLCKEKKAHANEVINYTIPQVWNTFGFSDGTLLRNQEMIVNPYEFYTFAIHKMLQDVKEHPCDASVSAIKKGKKGDWIKGSVLYFDNMRAVSCWDHDRSGSTEDVNMYGLHDQGTFLKAIILLPLIKRSGVTTLVLHNLLALNPRDGVHDFADPHALLSLRNIDPSLCDPLLPTMRVEAQAKAFIAVCHAYGLRVLLDYCPALLGRNNLYIKEHPDWFYWIDKEYLTRYHEPEAFGLPTGCIPTEKACRILYESDDVKNHISAFCENPMSRDEELYHNTIKDCADEQVLRHIEDTYHCTIAPMLSDQINANLPIEKEYTVVRFYADRHSHCPDKKAVPYILQDIIRMDLYPGKHPIQSLWDEILSALQMWVSDYQMDGFYFSRPYLLPEKLIKEMVSVVRKTSPHAALLVESTDMNDAPKWIKRGFDAISGASAYSIHDIYNYQYHSFAYGLLQAPMTQLAASEFLDTPRITQYDGDETLAKLCTFMNLFLPNAIPSLTSGQLCFEKQPQYLSCFNDQNFLNALARDDAQYRKQAMLDRYCYHYLRKDFHVFINMLEQFTKIRKQYLPAISDPNACIPVWFDTPKDYGIGFTFTMADRALLVVCNTNVHEESYLHIHTENMLWELPFQWTTMYQIYSTDDPYVHDIVLDDFQNIPLLFAPGEVKLIEIK